MNLRIKWLVLRPFSPRIYNQLLERIQVEPFTEETSYGFIIDILRSDFFEARFVEKFQSIETIIDPFGNETQIPRTRYTETKFRLQKRKDYIELHNPPRSIHSFISLIGSFASDGLAIYAAEIPVGSWLSILEEEASSIAVTGALITDLLLGKAVMAEVLLTGDAEVIGQIKLITAGRKYVLNQAEIVSTTVDASFKAIIKTESRVALHNNSQAGVELYRTYFEKLLGKFRAYNS